MDSLAMFFGAKKRRPARKEKKHVIVVGGRERKLHKGKNGGMFCKTKSGKTYVDAKFVRKHSPKRVRKSPKRSAGKRGRKSPKRRRSPKRSPKRRSPKRGRKSPKRRTRKSPKRTRRTRYGYGLGQPSLIDMMGPAGLTMPHRRLIPVRPVYPGSLMEM